MDKGGKKCSQEKQHNLWREVKKKFEGKSKNALKVSKKYGEGK